MCTEHKEFYMEMTHEDVVMMRLINQATAQGLTVAQHSQTREFLLFAPTGEVHLHPDVSLVRSWCIVFDPHDLGDFPKASSSKQAVIY
jgi:hypothetical protein